MCSSSPKLSDLDFDQYLDDEDVFALTTCETRLTLANKPDQDEKDEIVVSGDATSTAMAEDMEEPYSLEDLLEEAAAVYAGKKPEFCVSIPAERKRHIKMVENDQNGELTFRTWPGEACGFWVYTDALRDQYIVKCEKGKYHVWEGVDRGFCTSPLAVTGKTRTRQRSFSSNASDRTDKHCPKRSFRQRSVKQVKPYSAYNLRKKSENRGEAVTDSQIERALKENPNVKKVALSETATLKACKQHCSSQLSRSTSTTAAIVQEHDVTMSVSDDVVDQDAILRTRLNTSSGPAVVIYLAGIRNSQELFDKFRHKWTFKLKDKQLSYCIVRFPWLDEDSSIQFQAADDDGHRVLLETLRRAPGRKLCETVSVVVELRTD